MGTRKARIAAGAVLALLAGCGSQPRPPARPEPVRISRAEREREVNAEWRNHTLHELVATWGPPRLVMDIPGGGSPPGFVLVYPRDPASGCIDAFALMYGEVTRVRSYLCR